MQHTVEEMYDKVRNMLVLAEMAYKEKYNGKDEYDVTKVTHLVENVQAMCGDIYNDRTIHPKLKTKQEEMMWQEHDAPQYTFNEIEV